MIDSVLHWLADWWLVVVGVLVIAGMVFFFIQDVAAEAGRREAQKASWEKERRVRLIETLRGYGVDLDVEKTLAVWDQVKDELYQKEIDLRFAEWEGLDAERQKLEAEIRRRKSVLRMKKLRSQQRSARRLVGG